MKKKFYQGDDPEKVEAADQHRNREIISNFIRVKNLWVMSGRQVGC
jgi:hypothetical protein